jgi:hypothetical protein
MYVFAEVSKGGVNNAYMINPFIFYRKGGNPDKTLKTIFLFYSPKRGGFYFCWIL